MTSTRRPLRSIRDRPLVERARESLLKAIREDRFPGGRLPTEADLSEQLGVSRGTLREALQSLSADGIVSRRRRHGTTVNQHVLRSSMQLNRLVSFADLVRQSGYTAATDPEIIERRAASESEAAELEILPGTEVLSILRLLRADGQPVITVTDVLPVSRLIVPVKKLKASETTFDFLAANAGVTVDYATSEVIPRVASAAEPAGLKLEPGTPFIQLHEISFSSDNERVALSVVCVVDRFVRLSLLRRGR